MNLKFYSCFLALFFTGATFAQGDICRSDRTDYCYQSEITNPGQYEQRHLDFCFLGNSAYSIDCLSDVKQIMTEADLYSIPEDIMRRNGLRDSVIRERNVRSAGLCSLNVEGINKFTNRPSFKLALEQLASEKGYNLVYGSRSILRPRFDEDFTPAAYRLEYDYGYDCVVKMTMKTSRYEGRRSQEIVGEFRTPSPVTADAYPHCQNMMEGTLLEKLRQSHLIILESLQGMQTCENGSLL